MGIKTRKTKVQKRKRLIDLEVDEVSLVDKPAIGEPVYLTKSVKGDEMGTKKKTAASTKKGAAKAKVNKTEEEVENAEDLNEEVETEEEVAEATDTSKDASEESKDDDEEEDGEESEEETDEADEEEDEDDEGDDDAEKSALKAVNKRFAKIEKNLTDVEEMLTQSLSLHESVALAMNEIISLNMGALDAVMMLMEEPEGDESAMTEEQMSAITDIRESVKAVREKVSKAGAKISRTRMQALREIADKLSTLIESVEGSEKDGNKKSLAVVKGLQTGLDAITKKVEDVDKLKKKVSGFDQRLKSLENTADASDAIDDDDVDDEEVPDSDSTSKSDSVFKGLIPTDNIVARARKRKQFLENDK